MFGGGFNFNAPSSSTAATASGSIFGAQTTTNTGSLFGSKPTQATQPFGSTSLFGQPATQPTATTASTGLFGGGFGQPAASTSGGFGTAAKPPAFSFGGTAPTSTGASLFANPSTSAASPFGAQTSQPSLFGQPAAPTSSVPSTGLFGGAFGQSAQGTQVTGTTIKFNPLSATDTAQKGALSTNVTTKHMVITAMKEYEGKSLEELRFEDYMANRRGPSAGSTTTPATGGLFGSSTPAAKPGGLFGSTATSTPSQPLFGAASSAPATTTGFSFGAAPASTGGLFGTPTATTTTAAAAPFSFGATQTKPGLSIPTTSTPATGFSFGTPAPQPVTGGLFGAKPAAAAAPFGATQTSTFGAFGPTLTQPATTSAAPTSLFGAPSSTAPAVGGLFAAKPASSTPFSFNTAASAAPATGLFSAPATGNTFSFGQSTAQPLQNPLFGTSTTQAAPGFVSGNTGTGLFQFPSASNTQTAANLSAPTVGAGMNNVETAATAMMQALVHQKLLSLARCQPAYSVLFREPLSGGSNENQVSSSATRLGASSNAQAEFGSPSASSFGRSILPTSDGLGSLRTNLSVASSLPATTMTSRPQIASGMFELKPRFGSSSSSTSSRLGLSWTGGNSNTAHGASRWSPNKLAGESNGVSPRSVISPLSLAPRHSIRQLIPKRMTMDNSTVDVSDVENDQTRALGQKNTIPDTNLRNPDTGRGLNDHGLLGADISVVRPDGPDASFVERMSSGGSLPSSTPLNPRPNIGPGPTPRGRSDRNVPLIKVEEHQTPASQVSTSGKDWQALGDENAPSSQSPETRQRSSVQRRQQRIQQTRPILQRPGYTSIPRICDLEPTINESNGGEGVEWFAEEFQVMRDGFGAVIFHGRVKLTGLNLDQLIEIEHGEIVVYPDESIKPPVGQGLNRPSTLTLEGIFPEDKATREPAKSPEATSRYRNYLKEISGRLGATFVDYLPPSGSWIIKVPHFTRYGLLPSDECDIATDSPEVLKPQQSVLSTGTTAILKSTKMNMSVSETPFLNRSSVDAMHSENIIAMKTKTDRSGTDVQNFLDRIERLQSIAEKKLSDVTEVSSVDTGKQQALERPAKLKSVDHTVPKQPSCKRPRRIQWPVRDILPPPGFQTKTVGSHLLESVAADNYLVRGCRHSFVPGMSQENEKLLHVMPGSAKNESHVVRVVALSHPSDKMQGITFARFMERCIDVLNSWQVDNGTSIFDAMLECVRGDCSSLAFVQSSQKLFSLCAALWAPTSLSGSNETTKRKLLEWLGSYDHDKRHDNEINPELLFGRRANALRALSCQSPRLALLLAQAGGNPASLTNLLQQLSVWDQSGVLRRFMNGNNHNVNLIALAANCPYMEYEINSNKSTSAIQLFGKNSTERMGWRSALAAQLRYGPSALPSVPLTDAIREYDSFQANYPENYAPHALPPSTVDTGIDTAAYNLLLVYSKNDRESITEHLLKAIAAVQQSVSEPGCNIYQDWAASGCGEVLAWLLLRSFAKFGSFDLSGSNAATLARISMATGMKLVSVGSGLPDTFRNKVVKAIAESLDRPAIEIDCLLKGVSSSNS